MDVIVPTLTKTPTISVYRVAPFCLWKKPMSKVRGITGCECAICGMQVREPFKHVAIVIEGGAQWASAEEVANADPAGYMGEFPIGPNCHRKYRLTDAAD
jgi:hypothetical protein